jgi:hypothetical protein
MADDEKVSSEAPKVNGAASPLVIKLRKSVIANGDEVNDLSFREPTGADIERHGNPVIFDFAEEGYKPRYDTKSMTQMMAALASVPPSTIKALHPKDWNNIAICLSNFFVPDL